MTHAFRFASAAVFIGLAALSTAAQAAPTLTPQDVARIKTEVAAAVQNYADSFNNHDAKTIGEKLYNIPSTRVDARGVTVTDNAGEIAKSYEGAIKQAVASGWDHSTFPNPTVCVLTPDTALAGGPYYRFRKDGSTLTEGAETFVFTRTKDGWRIASQIMQNNGKIVTCAD